MTNRWLQVVEAVVLEAQQDSVVFLDALLEQGARRVQPPEHGKNTLTEPL